MTSLGTQIAMLVDWDRSTIVSLLAAPICAGVYIAYIKVRTMGPPHRRLRRKGLDWLFAGRPVDAEKCFRKSLEVTDKENRVRSLVCIADALLDQERFDECEELLNRALDLGDPTGSAHVTMTDLLLTTKTNPERALEMADQAVELTTRKSHSLYFGMNDIYHDLTRAKYWARRTQALVQLDRGAEARQNLDRALRLVNTATADAKRAKPRNSMMVSIILGRRISNHRDVSIALAHFEVGLALLAINDPSAAAEHFRITRDTDRRGKYRNLANQKLKELGLED